MSFLNGPNIDRNEFFLQPRLSERNRSLNLVFMNFKRL
jgi:hypothetical protein